MSMPPSPNGMMHAGMPPNSMMAAGGPMAALMQGAPMAGCFMPPPSMAPTMVMPAGAHPQGMQTSAMVGGSMQPKMVYYSADGYVATPAHMGAPMMVPMGSMAQMPAPATMGYHQQPRMMQPMGPPMHMMPPPQ